MSSQTKQSGSMQQLTCPMPGCGGVFADVDLFKMLPAAQAEQAYKRRRIQLETELRQELRREIEQELAAAASREAIAAEGSQLRQSLVNQALDMLVDQCRGCGQAFDEFDGSQREITCFKGSLLTRPARGVVAIPRRQIARAQKHSVFLPDRNATSEHDLLSMITSNENKEDNGTSDVHKLKI